MSVVLNFEMAAENPLLHASHCDQIYCGLLRTWHIKFKPLMLQEIPGKMSVDYKFGCYDVYQNNLATILRGMTLGCSFGYGTGIIVKDNSILATAI